VKKIEEDKDTQLASKPIPEVSNPVLKPEIAERLKARIRASETG